jgi:hypothetical protein
MVREGEEVVLLRRLTEAFRKQDWFTVLIETLIVVLGVFLGLQANNWNSERARRVADRQYLERLHAEVEELIDLRNDVIGPRQKNVEALESAVQVIFSEAEARTLSPLECSSIHHSHVYTDPSSELPTVSELISAGRIDSLSSQDVRRSIRRYEQGVASAQDIMEALNLGNLSLARTYPEMIRLNALVRDDFGLVRATSAAEHCDVEAMRASIPFRNDLAINRDRFDVYFNMTLQIPQQLLIDLHDVLDQELGLRHTDIRAATP